jgi:hypothetical protein
MVEGTSPIEPLPIDGLHLDPKNPRLPEEISGEDESELIEFVAEEYDSLRVAQSVAEYGYFQAEPLIGVEEDGTTFVVEGNRRLAALKLLTDESLRHTLDISDMEEWDEAAKSTRIPQVVPVLIQASRTLVAPLLGYRHISGIQPWEPWAQARFIGRMIEEEGHDFGETATLVGIGETDVRSDYRNYRIVKQLRDVGVDTEGPEERFGIFTRAMQSTNIRDYIGAPAPANVQPNTVPLPDDSRESAQDVLSWLFGNGETSPVISDSRQIRELSTVLSSPESVEVLKRTRDLEEAYISAGGLRGRILEHLGRARNELQRAREDYPMHAGDREIEDLLEGCRDALQSFESE